MNAVPARPTHLPHMLPSCVHARLALFAIRRMGTHGLADAHAVQAIVGGFGKDFRRPLVLLRALLVELAAAAAWPISIAPCCCPRMTPAEAMLLAVLARAGASPDTAGLLLADLIGVRRADGVLATATALAAAFADAGLPITA